MRVPAHIVQTLVDLRARRDFLNTAIDVLAQIWEGPEAQRPVPSSLARPRRSLHKPGKKAREQPSAGKSLVSDEAVRALLTKRGPLGAGRFSSALKLSAYTRRIALKDLAARGIVVITGVTSGTRIALPGQSAKEDL